MFRFLTIVWDESSGSETEYAKQLIDCFSKSSSDWKLKTHGGGMTSFHHLSSSGASRAYALSGNNGVVFGTLFERRTDPADPTPSQCAQPSEQECKNISESQGRRLIKNYWGRYVAFIADRTCKAKIVLRDPTGELPCYFTRTRGVYIFFSAISDCTPFQQQLKFTINWDFIAARIIIGTADTTGTALNEVSQLFGGESITIANGEAKRSFLWHPRAVYEASPIEDHDTAVATLRATVQSCSHTWATVYPKILHRLSGGLDSSIVFRCLSDGPSRPSLTCVSYYFPGSRSDERHWARLAATVGACEYIEAARDPRTVKFEQLLNIEPQVSPPFEDSFLEFSQSEYALAKERGISAISDGHGGDAIFGQYSLRYALSDYLQAHRLNADALKIALAIAPSLNLSLWETLRRGVRTAYTRSEWDLVGELMRNDRKFAPEGILNDAESRRGKLHPWLNSLSGLSRGAAITIYGISISRSFYDPFRGSRFYPEVVSPLMSQPVVEVCLRIPSYVHAAHGKSRGLARSAFSGRVPDKILQRFWKDRPAGVFEQQLVANLPFVKRFLLDGALVERQLVDRKRLLHALSESAAKSAGYVSEISDLLATEAWIQCWSGNKIQVAA